MSSVYRAYASDTVPVPELRIRKPKTIKVAGMTLNNIDPDAPIDEINAPKLKENLETLGIHPETAKKAGPKGHQLEKIQQQWHSDPQPLMGIVTNDHKRRRALNSDGSHEATIQHREFRKKLGLPDKAPPWKETLLKFHALTEKDKNILYNMGYHPDSIRNPHSLTVECMLRDLQRYRGSK